MKAHILARLLLILTAAFWAIVVYIFYLLIW